MAGLWFKNGRVVGVMRFGIEGLFFRIKSPGEFLDPKV